MSTTRMSHQTRNGDRIKPTNAGCCKFCKRWFDLSTEGDTYPDGTVAHEFCADEDTFARANAGDFRD